MLIDIAQKSVKYFKWSYPILYTESSSYPYAPLNSQNITGYIVLLH